MTLDGLCRICAGLPRRRRAAREIHQQTLTPCRGCGQACDRLFGDGLCRRCHETVDVAIQHEQKLVHEAAARARFDVLRPTRTVRPVRDVEADGVVYEAVDLSVRALAPGELEQALAEARGIPQRGIW